MWNVGGGMGGGGRCVLRMKKAPSASLHRPSAGKVCRVGNH